MTATFRFSEFFRFFQFFPPKLVYFWTKSRKKRYGCFFHSILTTDFNFCPKNIERTKLSNLKTLIFANFWGPEVVGSSSYQKNIGAKFTHLYIPSLCKEFFVMRHNLGHPNRHLCFGLWFKSVGNWKSEDTGQKSCPEGH